MKKNLLSFLAIFLIIEEWLWDLLTAFGSAPNHWLNLEQFEQWLSQTVLLINKVDINMKV
ncbi:hypothetical protein [Methylobacter tundripaludum]|uniref:hypothetical protein n=1 Tax=Methylobacter tundripaludum TaxID=173365 RepID=UPI0004DF298E|nr:hypothetical protein [Methylobacter tundripaludum]